MTQRIASRLVSARKSLAHSYDRLNLPWIEALQFLREFTLPKSIWVQIFDLDGNYWLGYAKESGEWNIHFSEFDDSLRNSVPITNSSIDTRIRGLDGLAQLMAAIVEFAETEASRINSAVDSSLASISEYFDVESGAADVSERGNEMTVREVIKLLKNDGWLLVATRGSHRQFKHPNKPGRVTVAGHEGDDLPPGTLNSILKQAGLK